MNDKTEKKAFDDQVKTLKKLPLRELARRLRETKKQRRRLQRSLKKLDKTHLAQHPYDVIPTQAQESYEQEVKALLEELSQQAELFWQLYTTIQAKFLKILLIILGIFGTASLIAYVN